MSNTETEKRTGLVGWWASNPVAANLLMLVCFLGGMMGYVRMDQQMFPVVTVNGAQVSVNWPGASAREVEEQIVTRIEEAVSDISGLKEIQASAREGSGNLTVFAELDADMSEFVQEVEQRVNSINTFPVEAFRPVVSKYQVRDWFMGLAVHGDVDAHTLGRISRDIRDKVSKLPGGLLAQNIGSLSEEVAIEISADDLRRYNLTIDDIANSVRRESLNASGGRIRTENGEVPLVARALADTEEEFGNIIISQTAESGALRIKDIARINDGLVDADLEVSYDGDNATFIMMPTLDEMQIVTYTDAIKKFVEEANDYSNEILPQGVKLSILWDDSRIFEARMGLIAESALLGALLVCIVLVLFLRPVVAFWVTIGIITAFAGGIMILPYLGVSWNVLSTFAVLLVIGVVVDDAIVVGESVHNQVESGQREGLSAAVYGTQLVVKPVVFGVATTIIAFLPWAFISGPERIFTQQITFVVIAALIFSIIECMLILPAHLAHMKTQNEHKMGAVERFQNRISSSLIWFANRIYRPVLEVALKFRYATCALFVSIFMIANALYSNGFINFSFMPEVESEEIFVTLDFPEGTPYARITQVRDQLLDSVEKTNAEFLEEYPEIPQGMIQRVCAVASQTRIQSWVGLTFAEDRPKKLKVLEISERLKKNVGPLDDADNIQFNYTANESDTGVTFLLSHPDFARLEQASDYVKDYLRSSYADLYYVRDNLSSASEELQMQLKPGANATGLTLRDITGQVNASFYGNEVMRLPRDGEDVKVMVRLLKSERQQLETLNTLQIRTNQGDLVPLRDVVDFKFQPGVNVINRQDRDRIIEVSADVSGERGRGVILKDLEKNFWPVFEEKFPDVAHRESGEIEAERDFFVEINGFVVMAFFAMYILLAIAFGSYTQPLLIMTAIPFAYTGALFGHYVSGVNLALFSFFGIAAAGGVVINDNLVLIDSVNRRRADGMGAIQSLVEAGVSRFRPILLTSVTTIIGILPLLSDPSMQAQFLKPMLIALASAVAFAIFVSLFLVPSMYAVGVEIGRFFTWTWTGKPFQMLGTTYERQAGSSIKTAV